MSRPVLSGRFADASVWQRPSFGQEWVTRKSARPLADSKFESKMSANFGLSVA
jgi:hypothetical protein